MHGEPGCLPREETADDVGGVHEAEILERGGCEARRLAVCADEDQLLLEAGDVWVVERRVDVRIESPLENGPGDVQRARDDPFEPRARRSSACR